MLASSKLSAQSVSQAPYSFPSFPSLCASGAKKYLACSLPWVGGVRAKGPTQRVRRGKKASDSAPAFYATSGGRVEWSGPPRCLPPPAAPSNSSSTISLWRCKCYPRNTRATKCSKGEGGREAARETGRNSQTCRFLEAAPVPLVCFPLHAPSKVASANSPARNKKIEVMHVQGFRQASVWALGSKPERQDSRQNLARNADDFPSLLLFRRRRSG